MDRYLPNLKSRRPFTVVDSSRALAASLSRPRTSVPLYFVSTPEEQMMLKEEEGDEDLLLPSLYDDEEKSHSSEITEEINEIQGDLQYKLEELARKNSQESIKRKTRRVSAFMRQKFLQKKFLSKLSSQRGKNAGVSMVQQNITGEFKEIEKLVKGYRSNNQKTDNILDEVLRRGAGEGKRKRIKGGGGPRKESHMTVKDLIHRLKTDPIKMQEFKQRIRKIKKERNREKRKHIKNKNVINEYVEEVKKQSKTKMRREKVKYLNLLEKRRSRAWKRQLRDRQARKAELEGRVELLEQKRDIQLRNLANRPARQKLWERQRKLLPLVVYSLFMMQLIQCLKQGRSNRIYQEQLKEAIVIVQKYMLPKIIIRRETKVRHAKEVIKKNAWLWVLSHRIKKRRRHLGVLKSVVLSLENSNRFSKQVHHFINRVKIAQKVVHEHLQKRAAQLNILIQYWEVLKVQVFREQEERDMKKYRVETEKYVQSLFTQLFDTSRKNESQRTRKHLKAKEMKLKEIINVMLLSNPNYAHNTLNASSQNLNSSSSNKDVPQNSVKKKMRTRELVCALLDNLRNRRDISIYDLRLKEVSKYLPVAWKVRPEIYEPIRDRLIKEDLLRRSREFRMKRIQRTLDEGENFCILPKVEDYKNLILQGQEMSRDREEALLRLHTTLEKRKMEVHVESSAASTIGLGKDVESSNDLNSVSTGDL